VRSVDREHGTRMDHIAPAPTTFPVIQVGYDTVLVTCKENERCQSINVCINYDAKGINPHFLMCRLKTKQMMRYQVPIVRLFLNSVGREHI
jgi:hypothetical protein